MRIFDLRSDTVTHPTEEMRIAMANAEVGDDVFEEDPTINKLEAMAAERFGKEAAVYVASGTMANLASGLAHCQRGDEAIIGAESHIFQNEAGSLSALGGVHIRTVPNDNLGMMDPDEIEAAIRPDNIHQPRTALISLENTQNRCSGAVLDSVYTEQVASIAHSHDIALHIDGARIFNAAVALSVSVSDLVRTADTVSFCLSKGLSCPVGSLVCGTRDTINLVRRNRKLLGGGMRQAGIIAAAGIVALETMVDRLSEDHESARILAKGLASIPSLVINPEMIQTNIVIFDVKTGPIPELLSALKIKGVLASYTGGRGVRMVTHYGITPEDIEEILNIVEAVA
ncbi:MAG: threonine aldolase [Chloroflexi bacterium]|jgi:threonine aldolase|nr:MAG: threonine aldolase [Chloroflexota bacterium]